MAVEAGDRVGRHPSQAPPLLRSSRLRAQPPPRLRRAVAGALRGLSDAHLSWMFRGQDIANRVRPCQGLLADRDLRLISRTFPLWGYSDGPSRSASGGIHPIGRRRPQSRNLAWLAPSAFGKEA